MEPQDDIQDVLDQMARLAPGPADAPAPPAKALARLKQSIESPEKAAAVPGQRSRNMKSNRRWAVAGLATVLGLALLMMLPSVRAAANDFLGLFRVEKFAPISVSPEQIAVLQQLEETGLNPGEFVSVDEPGEPQAVASLDEAESLTGIRARTVDFGAAPPAVYVMDGSSGYLNVDLEGARAIMSAAGADPTLLPDSLNGARVDFSMSPSVQQVWSDGTVLVQGPSPVVTYPPGIDPTVMGQALLQVLGMDPAEAAQVAQTIDWTSTMLLPIPTQFATYSEVRVDGVSGVMLTPVDGSSEAGLIWQKGGEIYMLSGPTGNDLLDLARRLR